jgi:hypothetical protein
MNEEKREYELEYDERQYNLMMDRIQAFKGGKLYLSSLINDLNALLNALILPDEEWKDTFISFVNDIDALHAVAIDREKSFLSPESQVYVIEDVDRLEKMVSQKLAVYPNSSTTAYNWQSPRWQI